MAKKKIVVELDERDMETLHIVADYLNEGDWENFDSPEKMERDWNRFVDHMYGGKKQSEFLFL